MPKAKEEFQTDLIKNLECCFGGVSYVAMTPDEVKGIAEILTNVIYDKTNAEKLSKYRSSKAGKEGDLIRQELFPAQKLFPRDAINAQRKKVADELGGIALGLMMTPENTMEPAGAVGTAATTPDSVAVKNFMKKILFVCTGNICRSTTAEAIARHVAKNIGKDAEYFFDSAGTHGYHVGESADPRAVKLGKERGVSFDGISSRKITKNDFEKFDLIFAMDRSHLRILQNLAEEKHLKKIQLFLSFSKIKNSWNDEAIDPYYGERGFEEVFDVIEEAVRKIIF